ncbi:MAG: hypothetical protein ACKVOR_04835 [Flavobacteriales bacterium]
MQKKIIATLSIIAIALVALLVMQASREEGIPKPRGYFRIELPDKKYEAYTSACGMQMQLPTYSKVEVRKENDKGDTCKFDIAFHRFKARIHCSHLPVNGNLEDLINEAYGFAATHQVKASAMKRTLVDNPANHVHGIIYDIEGDAASQIQFFLTDSTQHFFRGALYFFNTPNPDSVEPVLNFLREDLQRLTDSFSWK